MRMLLALLVIAALAGCAAPPSGAPAATTTPTVTPTATTPPPITPTPFSTTYADSFEGAPSAWRTAGVVPTDPNTGKPVAWNVTTTSERARTGGTALRFAIDGRQDAGAIWAYREIAVPPGRTYDVNVSAWAWSHVASFNALGHLLLYVGTAPPRDEGSFQVAAPLDASAGWSETWVRVRTPVGSEGRLVVAVGIGVAWETLLQYDVDDITVSVAQA